MADNIHPLFDFTDLIVHWRRPIKLRLKERVRAMSAVEKLRPMAWTTRASIVITAMKAIVIQSNREPIHRSVVIDKKHAWVLTFKCEQNSVEQICSALYDRITFNPSIVEVKYE